MNKKISELRLQKEEQSLEKQPHPQALITRAEYLNFHFCLFGLQEDFQKGFYHGVVELPEDYPFSPPKIKFLTENGRFQVGKPICTTFTHYHKETWSSSWNIRTILTALISFMYTNEKGIGGVFDSTARRKALAKKSLQNNLCNPLFLRLFKQKLISREVISTEQMELLVKRNADKQSKLKLKKQNLTSAQFRDEQLEESGFKLGELMIISEKEQREKGCDKSEQQNLSELMQHPSKKTHLQQPPATPLLYDNKLLDQANGHAE